MIRNAVRTVLSASVAVVAGMTGAHAQDEVKLKFAHVFPQNHYLWEHGGKEFADRVTEATGGKVTFEVYPASQLGKDTMTLVQSGLADIVTLVPSYTPDRMPLTSVAELPGFNSTTCQGAHKLWGIIKEGGALDEAEYKPQNLHVLFVAHQPTYKILTSRAQVKTVADVSGLKVRAAGDSMGTLVRSMDAVPISITSSEVYDSITRGTIDGTLLPYYSIPIYSLDAAVKFALDGPQLGGGPVVYSMTAEAWEALPDDTKTAFDQAALEAQDVLCTYQDDLEASTRQELEAAGKITITTVPDSDMAQWNETFDEVVEAWAKSLDGKGRPGGAILEAYRAVEVE